MACIVHDFCPDNRRCKACGILKKDYQFQEHLNESSRSVSTWPGWTQALRWKVPLNVPQASFDRYVQQCSKLTENSEQ